MKRASVRKGILFVVDAMICTIAFYISMVIWFEKNVTDWSFFWTYTPLIVSIEMLVFGLGGIYSILWRIADVEEALRIFLLSIVGGVLLLLVNGLFRLGIPPSMLTISSLLTIIGMSGVRFIWRITHSKRIRLRRAQSLEAIMVVGAGEAGTYVINRLLSSDESHNKTIVLVDDDPSKQNMRIHNIGILGTLEQIPGLVQMHNVKEIIIAIPSLRGERFTQLVTTCRKSKCRVRVFHDGDQADGIYNGSSAHEIRELDASDFLSRDEVRLDVKAISKYLTGRRVMVTGGGGSIGSELCRQIMKFSPELLIIFDIYENYAYELEMALKHSYGKDCPVRVLIGSVQDGIRMDEVLAAYRPEIVFHAAAYKHVPLMEISPAEAVKNNVFGTMTLLETAYRYKVERFVLLSTDKAVNPTTVMGATKRITEMLVQLYAKSSSMKCMAVRFGNVLGSHGSVIPLFDTQIKAGGPVTVTDPDVTRYFMTIAEAAQLVLQAGGMANSGVIHLLDMGQPIRIADLAEQMIRFYGYEPGVDMEIVYTGLRAGEKLHEELLMETEKTAIKQTDHSKIFTTPCHDMDEVLFREQLQRLRKIAYEGVSTDILFEMIAEIVGTYHYRHAERCAV